ncbi:MAG: serine hydrolase [Clostridium sp.]|nr:serine hydrolase [Clostridium sp.]
MKEIEKYLKTRIGKYSFFFEDLKGGFTYGLNENEEMIAAGCMKLPIAISLIKAEEDKKVDFLEKISIEKKDKVFGTGIIHEFEDRQYTIFELLVVMLIQSDNTAANKLIDILGIDNINRDIKSMELTHTFLNRKTRDERFVNEDGKENITTAKDLSKMWSVLYNSNFLSKENSVMLIDILTRQQIKNKLALYIPDNSKYNIASKSGDKDGIENDTSLIHLDKGDFVFTVLSNNIPNSVYGTVTLAKCGKMMWDNILNNWS